MEEIFIGVRSRTSSSLFTGLSASQQACADTATPGKPSSCKRGKATPEREGTRRNRGDGMTSAKSVAKRKEGSEAVRTAEAGQEVYCMSQERRAAAAFTRKSHLRDQLM